MDALYICLASILDLIFGDPEWFPHPVRAIGKIISSLDNNLHGYSGKWVERTKGAITVFVTLGITFISAYFLMTTLQKVNTLLEGLVWIYLGYVCISIKDLQNRAEDICKELEKQNIEEARKKLSKIVGRDTKDLSRDKIITATVESVAENTNDGIIAPLFYLVLGGPVFAITYKAINTLDSMLGYKNEKYIHFGWFSARLDDIANYVPARICGILMSISSFITGKNFRDSLKILIRDGKNHPSPNSGISEAAMAGALGIKLSGPSFYQGKLIVKPYIGEGRREINCKLINDALRISLITSFLGIILGVIFKCAI